MKRLSMVAVAALFTLGGCGHQQVSYGPAVGYGPPLEVPSTAATPSPIATALQAINDQYSKQAAEAADLWQHRDELAKSIGPFKGEQALSEAIKQCDTGWMGYNHEVRSCKGRDKQCKDTFMLENGRTMTTKWFEDLPWGAREDIYKPGDGICSGFKPDRVEESCRRKMELVDTARHQVNGASGQIDDASTRELAIRQCSRAKLNWLYYHFPDEETRRELDEADLNREKLKTYKAWIKAHPDQAYPEP